MFGFILGAEKYYLEKCFSEGSDMLLKLCHKNDFEIYVQRECVCVQKIFQEGLRCECVWGS